MRAAYDRLERVSRHVALLWLAVVVAASAAGLVLLSGGAHEAGQAVYGLLLAGYGAVAMGAAGRLQTLGTVVIIAAGMAFSLWFDVWVEEATGVVVAWLEGFGLGAWGEVLAVPVVVAALAWMTGALLYVATGCGRVVAQAGLLGLVAGVALALPRHAVEGAALAGVIWHAGVSGSLLRWGLSRYRVSLGLGCPACGADLTGLTVRVCPRCGLHLPSDDGHHGSALEAIEAAQRMLSERAAG